MSSLCSGPLPYCLCKLRPRHPPGPLAVSKFTKKNNVHTTVMIRVAADGRKAGCGEVLFSSEKEQRDRGARLVAEPDTGGLNTARDRTCGSLVSLSTAD